MSRRRKKQSGKSPLVATNIDQAYLLYMKMHDNKAPTASRFKKFINDDKRVQMTGIDFVTADQYLRTTGKGRTSASPSGGTYTASAPKKKGKKKRRRNRTVSISATTGAAAAALPKKKKKNKHYRQTRSEDLTGFDFTKESNKARAEVQIASIADFSSLKPSKALKHAKRKKRSQQKGKGPTTPKSGKRSKKSRKALPTIKAHREKHESVPIPPDHEISALIDSVVIPSRSPSHSPRRKNSPAQSPKHSHKKKAHGSNGVLKSFPFVEHMTEKEVQRLEIMDKLDHRYSNGLYLAAQVVQMNGSKYKIRYGNNRNNEAWSDYKYELYRFAKQHSITLRPAHRMLEVHIGDGVDINAKKFKKKGKKQGWRKGVLAKKDYKSGQVQVEYVSRGKKHHYWTHLDNTKEIAPYKSMTEAHRRKKAAQKQQQKVEANVVVKEITTNTPPSEFTFDLNMSITEQMKAYTAQTQLTESPDVDATVPMIAEPMNGNNKAKDANAFDINMSISEQMNAYKTPTDAKEVVKSPSNEHKAVDMNASIAEQMKAYTAPATHTKEAKGFDMNVSISEQMKAHSPTKTRSPQKEYKGFDMNVSIAEQMKAFSANNTRSPPKAYSEFDINKPISEQMKAYSATTNHTPPKAYSPDKSRSPKKEYKAVDMNVSIAQQMSPTKTRSPQKEPVSPFSISERMKAYTAALQQPQKEIEKQTHSGTRKKKQKPVNMELDYMNVYSWSNEEVVYWFRTMEDGHFGSEDRYETLREGLKQWDIKGKDLWQINDVFLRMLQVNAAKDRALIIDNIQKSAPKPMVSNGRKRGHRRQFSQEDMDLGIKKATQQVTKENELLHGEISKLQNANRQISSDHTQKVSELSQLQRLYDGVQKQMKKPSTDLVRARQENKDINDQLHQLTLRLQQQDEELKSRNEDVATMRQQMSAMNKEIHKKDDKIAALKSAKQKEIASLKQQLARVTTQYEELNVKYTKQTQELNDSTKDSYYEKQRTMMNGGGGGHNNVITPIDTTHSINNDDEIKDQQRKPITPYETTPETPSESPTITGNEDYIEYEESDEIRTIIVDNGSESIKLGYGPLDVNDSHKPQKKFHCIIGRPKHGNTYQNENEMLVGDEAFNKSSILNIENVIQRGRVTDWDLMERVWHYTFYRKLGIPQTEQLTHRNVLLTESILRPKEDREKSVQIMFETFDTNAMFMENEACLSLYAVGKVTGTVLGIGYGVSYSTAIFEGSCIPKSVARIHSAGYDITQCLKSVLSKRYSSILNKTKHYVMKDMKQKYCYVAENFRESLAQKKDSYKKYKLPDGQCIRIGNERFIACEQLFGGFMNLNGEDVKRDHRELFNHNAGIHDMVWRSMNAVPDEDLQKELYDTGVVLSGGSTMFKGLPSRLKSELYKVSHQAMNIIVPEKRKYLAWIGGSILSSLPNYRENFITKSEYQEYGAAIVHRKCA